MRLERRIQILATGALLCSVAASAALTPMISAEAGRAQLGYADRAEESDPPEVALGIALGAFRGLFVNLLWFRAQELKEEGKFYEAIEVARAITRLQPRFPRVWVFHGWNLAYNISVATNTAEERWQWVNAGINLLRNEGIRKNPHETLIHKELAWIFIHKIQGFTDDANQYYKRQVAREWTFLMGAPPERPQPDDPDVRAHYEALAASLAGSGDEPSLSEAIRRAATDRRTEILELIRQAPDTFDQLYAAEPGAAELVRRLRDEAGVQLDIDLLRLVETQRALHRLRSTLGVGVQIGDTERNRRFEAIFYDERHTDAGRALLPFVRKRVLIRDYNMELDRMIEYTRVFGPLDWRHPATHALYWASRGVEEGLRRRNTEDFNIVNTDRVVLHAAQELFRWGDLYYDLLNDSYLAMVNFDYVDTYTTALRIVDQRAAQRSRVRGEEDVEDPGRHFRLYSEGYANFLRDVIRIYHRMGDVAKANEYFQFLRTWPFLNMNSPDFLKQELALPLAQFVRVEFQDRIISPEVAQTEIVASLQDAFVRGLLGADQRIFRAQLQYAFDVHSYYMGEQNLRTMADAQRNRLQFLEPRFIDTAVSVLISILGSGAVSPEQSAMIWRRCPLGLTQAAYDRLRERAAPALGMEQFNVVFPEPPGMEEYRQLREQLESTSEQQRRRLMNFEQQ